MSPKAPATPVDPELDRRRVETLQLLDTVFPEISKTLPEKDILAALLAVEADEVAFYEGDLKRAPSSAAHFFIAGRLWPQHWEKLLVSAVRQRLGPTITDRQVFTAAGALDPPKPASKWDGASWFGWVDAVTLRVQAGLPLPSGGAAAQMSAETREWQSAFAVEFGKRLRSHLAEHD